MHGTNQVKYNVISERREHIPSAFLYFEARTFSISCIQLVYDIHPFNDFANGRESLLVKKPVSLGVCVDKYLSCSCIWTSRRKYNGTT